MIKEPERIEGKGNKCITGLMAEIVRSIGPVDAAES